MISSHRQLLLSTAWGLVGVIWGTSASPILAMVPSSIGSILSAPASRFHHPVTPSERPQIRTALNQSSCPKPALSRLVQHTIAPGETLADIAQRYNLVPVTLMGMNPALRRGEVPVGTRIVVPPYNGIRVAVPAGQRLKDVAATYKVRPDVLYEVNGCQSTPKVVFVPGVNWSPIATPGQSSKTRDRQSLQNTPERFRQYPLPTPVPIALGYGWGVEPTTGKVAFHSGVDLGAPKGTPVFAAASGTIAFAGKQGSYGNLVVVNHSEGRQTRYAQLDSISVSVGQAVKQSSTLGRVGATGQASRPHLHFEIRVYSSLGWVAQDPTGYLPLLQALRSRP